MFQTKIIPSEKSHNAKNCKSVKISQGPLRFSNIHSNAKFQKNEGRTFGDIKNFSKKSLTKP